MQFDDTNWAFLADQTKQEELRAKGIQPEEIAQVCTTIINEALAGKPEDLTVTTHLPWEPCFVLVIFRWL